MDKGRFEAFCTDAMLLIHEVVECAASPPAERSEAEEDMLRQGRAVARALRFRFRGVSNSTSHVSPKRGSLPQHRAR